LGTDVAGRESRSQELGVGINTGERMEEGGVRRRKYWRDLARWLSTFSLLSPEFSPVFIPTPDS
jgi:hypothetical protein